MSFFQCVCLSVGLGRKPRQWRGIWPYVNANKRDFLLDPRWKAVNIADKKMMLNHCHPTDRSGQLPVRMWSNRRRPHCQSISGDLPWLFEEVGKDGCTNHDESALKYYCSSIPEGKSQNAGWIQVPLAIGRRMLGYSMSFLLWKIRWSDMCSTIRSTHLRQAHPVFIVCYGEPNGPGRYP